MKPVDDEVSSNNIFLLQYGELGEMDSWMLKQCEKKLWGGKKHSTSKLNFDLSYVSTSNEVGLWPLLCVSRSNAGQVADVTRGQSMRRKKSLSTKVRGLKIQRNVFSGEGRASCKLPTRIRKKLIRILGIFRTPQKNTLLPERKRKTKWRLRQRPRPLSVTVSVKSLHEKKGGKKWPPCWMSRMPIILIWTWEEEFHMVRHPLRHWSF